MREIFAAAFRDRVVHHLMYNFFEPIFEPQFIAQSYACRKGKGSHQSLKDLKRYLLKLTNNHRDNAYFLHLDVRAFFMNIRKDILFKIVQKHVRNPKLLWLAETIIFNDPTQNFIKKGNASLFSKLPPHKSLFGVPNTQGLPIGNLSSQFFGNVYLNELDHFVKHNLKAKYYLRYVDDFLLLSRDKEELKQWRNEIIKFLADNLQLELNHKKEILQSNDKGINWLGYIVKPHYTLSRRRVVKSLRNKVFLFSKGLTESYAKKEPPLEVIEDMIAVINSYFGYFKHADTFRLRKHITERELKEISKYLEQKDPHFASLRIKPDYLERAKRAR